jgi:transcriptional regulator with XRE-family HTH domain
MTGTFKQFKARALRRPGVRKAYVELAEEFSFIDEVLKARAASGLTQAELAARVGTTQSAIARLESGTPKYSPSIVTLQRYARAMGYRVEVKLVKERGLTARSKGRA